MTKARIDRVHADRMLARDHLAQAGQLLADADANSLSAAGRSILLHAAVVSACDAILHMAGVRVTPGDGSHVLRLQEALDRLDEDTDELLDSLDAARERRNEASYSAAIVAAASVADAREATAELLALAHAFVG